MSGIDKKTEGPKPDHTKSKKPPEPVPDDDCEDGDMATPKYDPCGDDDEPL